MSKKTILLVEDDAGVTETVTMLLETDYNIVHSKTVDEGIQKAREVFPDLIITDNQTPGSSTGLDLIRIFQKELAMIPIIMMSGSDVEYKAKELGVNAFFAKPFDGYEFQEAIKKQLELRKGASNDI